MKKLLILFAHPALQRSRVNKYLIEGLDNIEGVTFHDLYQSYPEFDIDSVEEQELLVEHDIVVLQHPFFWYSIPAILKEWQDLVLEHGWAYGSDGNALKDKMCINVMSTGGRAEAYQEDGYNGHTIRQFLAPIEQTFRLCKMIYLPPYVVHGTHSITKQEIEKHRETYLRIIKLLRDERLDIAKAEGLNYMNEYFV